MGDASEISEGSSFAGEAPKRSSRPNVHWKRPKSNLYEYNYDYGSNYYRPMIDYLNERATGGHPAMPKPMLWEERALKSYMDRNHRASASKVSRDAMLLQSLRSSTNRYMEHTKTFIARRVAGV